jgi:hypothetical protein
VARATRWRMWASARAARSTTSGGARGAQNSLDDIDRSYGRREPRHREDQNRAAQREAQDAAFNERLQALGRAELELRATQNAALGAEFATQLKILKDFNAGFLTSGEKVINDLARLLEDTTP